MKLLLYCTKAKPYLVKGLAKPMHTLDKNNPFNFNWKLVKKGFSNDRLNGKIVAECDFEVEEIGQHRQFLGFGYDLFFETETLEDLELQEKSCLDTQQLANYFNSNADCGEKVGYAIHIKNLHIFDEPRELNDYNYLRTSFFGTLGNAPQNMMYAYDNGEKKTLISIRPEWLCKILNGEKTIEVRKKVLKEMLE